MKLTTEQITYIENYIKKSGVKYYEIYMEILDHMILGVDAILLEDKSISFEDAVLKIKVEGFGKKGFSEIEVEKVKLANQKNKKEHFKMIKEYFTFPKIILSILIFSVYYYFLSFFENPAKANVISITLVCFFGIFQTVYSWKFRKIQKMNVLKTQVLNNTFFLSFLGMQITSTFTNFGKESIDFNHILMRLVMTFIFTFSVLSVLVYIDVRKKTIIELKNVIFA